jgi:spoIIIJ-associated protein
MMDFSEKWGKDVEDATKLALADLALTIDEVNVIVLEAPTKGFLGIGSKLAKVRVEKKKPLTSEQLREKARVEEEEKRLKFKAQEDERRLQAKQEEEKTEKAKLESKAPAIQRLDQKIIDQDKKPERAANTNREEKVFSKPKREDKPFERHRGEDRKMVIPSASTEVQGSPAEAFLQEMTQKMGLDLSINVYEGEESVYVNIGGKDSGTIIGKRGQTLDAVQYLTSLVVNKDKEKHARVVVNAENYREKREKTLEQLAKRLADKVLKTGKSVRLEPMNPYERKVIHATLQGSTGVTTRSEGEEPYRRVIIELK